MLTLPGKAPLDDRVSRSDGNEGTVEELSREPSIRKEGMAVGFRPLTNRGFAVTV
jgi:hypothetical protein